MFIYLKGLTLILRYIYFVRDHITQYVYPCIHISF